MAVEHEQEWVVRPVSGQAARKPYLCPHCLTSINVGQAHVVVWPAAYVAGDPTELRRHWHSSCWRRGGGRLG